VPGDRPPIEPDSVVVNCALEGGGSDGEEIGINASSFPLEVRYCPVILNDYLESEDRMVASLLPME